jgi:hypothetical protein
MPNIRPGRNRGAGAADVWMFTGSVIDLASFVPRLPEMARKEALGSPLTWIVHPQTDGQNGQPALIPRRPSGLLLDRIA